MGSSRFPGKPLARILGLSMVEHVYLRSTMCSALDQVYVATCDQEIYEAVEAFGGKAIMTSPDHERASDRVAEAARDLAADFIVMLQGDEPMTYPHMMELALEPLINDSGIVCSNLIHPIKTHEEFIDTNTIKVVMDREGFALYFSREPIPTRSVLGFEQLSAYKQVCVIPFRRDFLLKFAELEPTHLEKAESVDMMRALEHGYKIKLVESPFESHAVDTPDDLLRVEDMMKSDPLVPRYIEDYR